MNTNFFLNLKRIQHQCQFELQNRVAPSYLRDDAVTKYINNNNYRTYSYNLMLNITIFYKVLKTIVCM